MAASGRLQRPFFMKRVGNGWVRVPTHRGLGPSYNFNYDRAYMKEYRKRLKAQRAQKGLRENPEYRDFYGDDAVLTLENPRRRRRHGRVRSGHNPTGIAAVPVFVWALAGILGYALWKRGQVPAPTAGAE